MNYSNAWWSTSSSWAIDTTTFGDPLVYRYELPQPAPKPQTPKSDDPLAWVRERVDSICDLGRLR